MFKLNSVSDPVGEVRDILTACFTYINGEGNRFCFSKINNYLTDTVTFNFFITS
jgi:hypothetical protein